MNNAKNGFFDVLPGTWKGGETVFETPWTKDGISNGIIRCSHILNGSFLELDYSSSMEGNADWFTARAIIGKDTENSEVPVWWFDSFGSHTDSSVTGSWDGTFFRFVRISDYAETVHEYSIGEEGRLRFILWTVLKDADPMPVLKGEYRKS